MRMNRTARVEALHSPSRRDCQGDGIAYAQGSRSMEAPDDDKEHKQSPGNVDADATVRAMGTSECMEPGKNPASAWGVAWL